MPYEPLDGQLIALQHRLMRAARAMLDPMLNLGLIEPATARAVLLRTRSCCRPRWCARSSTATCSAPPARRAATSTATRAFRSCARETELALGARFDRQAFNDFVLGQGLLPPDAAGEGGARAVHRRGSRARRA